MAIKRPIISTGIEAETIARNHPDSAVWLASDTEGRTLALFQAERELPAKGALVILADEGMSAASGVADALRDSLSRAGWAVITLGLPQPPFAVQEWLRQQNNAAPGSADGAVDKQAAKENPQAEQGQAAQEEQSSVMINVMSDVMPDKALTQYRNQVVASLTAAVDALKKREYQRVVLAGIGRASGHLTRQLLEDERVSDLIWIAPHFYTDESDGLTELLAAATSPSVLELYSTFSADRTLDRAADEREAAMARAGVKGYRRQPVAMTRHPKAREAHKLANRISAWLQSTAR